MQVSRVLGFSIFFFLVSFSQAWDRDTLQSKYPALKNNFFSKLKSEDGLQYWEGQQELHPVWDLMFYLTALKTGFDDPAIKDEVFKRVFAWQRSDGTWPLTPHGDTHFDVTAAMALGLERLGLERQDGRTQGAWAYLNAQRLGEKSGRQINILFRIFLSMLEILPREAIPRFPTKIIGFPKGMPMSPMDLGIFRTMLVPLLVWDFYQDPRHRVEAIQVARIQSAGSQMGTLRPDDKLKSFITKPIDEVLNFLGSDWSNFASWVGGVSSHQSDNFWAQEGLGYLLSRQQSDGGWYVLGNSLASILTLQKIIDRGVESSVDLNQAVERGIQALLKWRKLAHDENGVPFIPAARSNIWDSSLALQNLLLEKDHSPSEQTQIENVAMWLMNSAQTQDGDWSAQNPLTPGSYMAWSFYPEARWHPDTDDSASVLEVLLHVRFSDPAAEAKRVQSLQKGLHWIISQRNADGGFPAWEKGASELSNALMLKMLEGMPRVSDFSQADVSARILRLLVKVKKDSSLQNSLPDAAIAQTCTFLKSRQEIKDGAVLWEGDWIADYGYGTAEVITALVEANEVQSDCLDAASARSIAQDFVRRQNPDGGWGESVQSYAQANYVRSSSTLLQTSFIVKMLMRVETSERAHNGGAATDLYPSISKAMDFILSRSTSEGDLTEKSFTGVYVKGFIFSDYTLMPHYHSLGALNEARKLIPEVVQE